METIKINDGLYIFDQGFVRSFLIIGENKAILLDTGAEPFDILNEIEKVIGNKEVMLIQTHSDFDHMANSKHFEIHCLKEEMPFIDAKCKEVFDGQIIDLGQREIEVIALKGHTPGSLGLIDHTNKILFSGDTVSYGPVYMFGEKRNLNDYEESLIKLKERSNEFETIYPCHNICPIDNNVIDELLEVTKGIKNGTIIGNKTDFNRSPEVLVYTYNKSGIFY